MSSVPVLSQSRKSFQVKDLRRTQTIFLTSIAITLIVLLFSPNYQFSQSDRLTPLGSDFLQEWTGGYIWSSAHRSELYQAEHFKRIQHDSSIVGFSWPESQYYPMVYPPFYYMVLSPLSKLPYWVAVVVWAIVLAISSATTLWIWTAYYPPAREHWGKCLLVMVAFFPFVMSLNTAHKSIFLLLILVATYLLLYSKKAVSGWTRVWPDCIQATLGNPDRARDAVKKAVGVCRWQFVDRFDLGWACHWLLALIFVMTISGSVLGMGNYSSTGGYLLAESHNLIGAISLTFGTGTIASKLISLVFGPTTLVGNCDCMSGEVRYRFRSICDSIFRTGFGHDTT